MQNVLCAFLAIFLSGIAQQPGQRIPEVELRGVNVLSAMDTVVADNQGSYLLHPWVEGRIELSLKNHTVDQVVRQIAWQAGAQMDLKSGVYIVWAKGHENEYEDPEEIVVPGAELNKVPIRSALAALLGAVNCSFTMEPAVKGTVTASFRNLPMQSMLRIILNQVGATYRIEGGVYQIILRQGCMDPNPSIASS